MLIALPEIFTLVLALLVLIVDLVFSKKVWVTLSISLIGLMAIILLLLSQYDLAEQTIFSGHYKFDKLAVLLKLSVVILSIMAMLYSYVYLNYHDAKLSGEELINSYTLRGEYFTLIILSILGGLVLISANSLITIYLGLEMVSLTLYGMVAWHKRDPKSTEAAIKYFVLGSIASGLLLYGMSLIYGATGSLLLSEINLNMDESGLLLLFAFVFLLAGLSFKLGVIPFHMWLPDVYQGGSAPVVAFIASIVKIMMFASLLRLWVQSIEVSHQQIELILIFVALSSIILGNIIAIVQKNIRRMLAYSSIAHMGFVVLAMVANTDQAVQAASFYVIMYALMSLAAFTIFSYIRINGQEIQNITDLKGLNKQQPWCAFLLLLLMFSMAGIPPTVGFHIKLGVLQAIMDEGFYYEAAVALLFSVIGSFYYLQVIRCMYFDTTNSSSSKLSTILSAKLAAKGLNYSKVIILLLSVNVLLLLALGIYPISITHWFF